MKVTVVEGTPAELAEAFPALFATTRQELVARSSGPPAEVEKVQATPVPEPTSDGIPNGSAETSEFVTKAVAQKMLRRRPLAPEQRTTIKEIHAAYPKTALATELQMKLNYTPAQFAGLMGAFGRRLSHTGGFVAGTKFFAKEWDYTAGCYRYSLPNSVREAVAEEAWASN